jgi:hypothetical protein
MRFRWCQQLTAVSLCVTCVHYLTDGHEKHTHVLLSSEATVRAAREYEEDAWLTCDPTL